MIKLTGDLKFTLDILSSGNLNKSAWVVGIEKRSYAQLKGNFILTLYFPRSVMSVWNIKKTDEKKSKNPN